MTKQKIKRILRIVFITASIASLAFVPWILVKAWIMSIGKLYVAVAIAKLFKDKRLSLDKIVADYFPELVGRIKNAEKITVKMMVQHRSGIPNYIDHPTYWKKQPKNNQEALELAIDMTASFKPGEDY